MRRVVLVLAAVAGLVSVPAPPSMASWVGNNCYANNQTDSNYRRADARAYVERALKEGYEWGGGCWNDNNVDDTPNAPNSGGEGPDCSGLVFKSWELESAYGTGGFRWWSRIQNIHGPYVAEDFHDPGPGWVPFYRVLKSETLYMDAFARDSHVGLLYSDVQNSSGTYTYAEAKGDAYGTNLFEESWMSDSAYTAARRRGWTADCWPRCPTAPAVSVVVVA